ncbi:MAG: YbaB/EbfC family nucleoid-associated protein [Clostridia bacterium]|nr:YbaB/EbfC family nucleoid-associated protein [Clostridia bacterium]
MAGYGRGGFGGFGGGNQMQQLMKQAQKMQAEMQKAQEELENAEIEGVAQGDAVKVIMNGKKVVSSISINPDYVDLDDIEMLEDLIVVALNDAYQKADEMNKQKMGNAGGLF